MKKEKTSAVVVHMEDGLIEAIDGLPKGTKILVLDYTLNLDPDYEPCSCKQGMREHAHREMLAE
jgi:hypothetical protein